MDTIFCRYDIEELADDMGVDFDTISSLYIEYFIEMKENIQKCIALSKENNWVGLERIIHNIKGTSISLNIKDLYYASINLSNQLKSNKYDHIADGVTIINDLLIAAEVSIKEFFNQKGITL